MKRFAFVGIHTHGACLKGYNNMGLLFTPKILEKINEYIKLNLEDDDESSEYSERMGDFDD